MSCKRRRLNGYIVIAWPGIDVVRALRWLCIATVLLSIVFSAGVVVGYHLRKYKEKLPEREHEAAPEPEPEATSQRREVAHAETATVVSEALVSVDFPVPPPPPSPPTVYMAQCGDVYHVSRQCPALKCCVYGVRSHRVCRRCG